MRRSSIITIGGRCAGAFPTVVACRTEEARPAAGHSSGRPMPAMGRGQHWACNSEACGGWGASRVAVAGAEGVG